MYLTKESDVEKRSVRIYELKPKQLYDEGIFI